ncbi:MAG: hypothetical protein H6Q49_873, partial [Deltaproteobacteria bacterium]|nr:hypothetical protein [Deltaproteobacteria bacterium]
MVQPVKLLILKGVCYGTDQNHAMSG